MTDSLVMYEAGPFKGRELKALTRKSTGAKRAETLNHFIKAS
jgi:hypothetical protein